MGKVLAFAVLMISLCAPAALAEYKIAADPAAIGVGARPLGMGKRFVSLAGDTSDIFLNPAGLAGIKKLALSSMSGKLLNEFNYINLAAAWPTRFGPVGLGFVNSNIGFHASAATIETTDGIRIYPSTTEGVSFSDNRNAVLLAWAFPWRQFFFGSTAKLYFGQLTGPGISGGKFQGWNVDLGAQYRLNPVFQLGASLQNVAPASAGAVIKWDNGTQERLPRIIKAGARVKLLGEDGARRFGKHTLSLLVDGDYSLFFPNYPIQYHAGLEWSPVELIDFRVGLDQDITGLSTGAEVANNLTAGLGLWFRDFRFDYAFHQYNNITSNDTHYFSLSWGLEREKPEEPPAPLIPTAPPLRRGVLKVANFADVAADLRSAKAILELKTSKIVLGYPDGNFRPNDEITRAELATILARGRSLSNPFRLEILPKDVRAGHWAAYYISEVLSAGIMQSDAAGNFDPKAKVSRAAAAASAARFARLPLGRLLEPPYEDVPGRRQFAREIAAAKEAGLLGFAEEKLFLPEKNLTRGEAAEMIAGTARVREFIEEFYEYEN